MIIKGKEYVDWLHDIRKSNARSRKSRKISGEEWLILVAEKAEKILCKPTVKPRKPVVASR